jgi:hypothetical protein
MKPHGEKRDRPNQESESLQEAVVAGAALIGAPYVFGKPPRLR